MFRIDNDTALTPEVLGQMMSVFLTDVRPQMERWKNYYLGKQDILTKTYHDTTKPCGHVVTNFCKNITDIYAGYIAAPGCITYQSEKDISLVIQALKYNDASAEDVELLRNALIYGVGSEIMFIDNKKEVRFSVVDSLTSFPIYSSDLTGDLLYFVNWTRNNNWNFSTQEYTLNVFDDKNVTTYTMTGEGGALTLLEKKRHYFSQCPANVFYIQDEKSIFDCIMSLQDAYNDLITSQGDEITGLSDSYLAISGNFDADSFYENLSVIRENRTILLPEGCTVSWLTKDLSATQSNSFSDRLREDIYRIACCPDFSSDTFIGGVSSGIAIKYRLTGCETRAANIEAQMKKALQRRIEIICGFASLMLGEEIFRDIKINFERNIPEDINSIAQAISTLKGVVSDETLMTQLPFVDNPKEEVEKVRAENDQQMKLYNFGDEDEGVV